MYNAFMGFRFNKSEEFSLKQKIGVFIGRFQPFHNGHLSVLEKMVDDGCDEIVILIGSANAYKSIKNPWTFYERVEMIRNVLSNNEKFSQIRIEYNALKDHLYNDAIWKKEVQESLVYEEEYTEVVLYGHSKDESSYYLREFPQWKTVEVEDSSGISATHIRECLFDALRYQLSEPTVEIKSIEPMIPEEVLGFIIENYVYANNLPLDDWSYYLKEKEMFKGYPYPETLNFICADAVLECAGHILVIQRKNAPGAGSWALPGGFLNKNEKLVDAAIRELYEETNVKVPEKVLRGSIKNIMLFDHPDRSCGNRRITQAVHMKINTDPYGRLPKVRASDDAVNARWISINNILSKGYMYDDHSSIIETMCSAGM